MDNDLKNRKNNCLCEKKINNECTDKCSKISFINGSPKSVLVNLPISEYEARKTIIIDTISINISCYCEPKIKIDFSVNILKDQSVQVSGMNFQVYKICDNISYKVPVGGNLFYQNNSTDLLQITVYDDNVCNSKKCTYVLEAII